MSPHKRKTNNTYSSHSKGRNPHRRTSWKLVRN